MKTDFDDKTREQLDEYNEALADLCELERKVLIDGDNELHKIAVIGLFDFLVHLARSGHLDLVEQCANGIDRAIGYNRLGKKQSEIRRKKYAERNKT
ncbi:hypothetical protein [Hyphococcus luteus]|jgi:hypothetical protein|uniref:Uncharacterized protein n=1 Tax=Hyphococcus luteus TaxID=2058213 RepID=A0A2S7K1C6_9PROT|nr:hypothetical protein [Marinicaulis flavus]PQA86317.1 hypothetical protein CW354_18415 [Marinicaulis flavus]